MPSSASPLQRFYVNVTKKIPHPPSKVSARLVSTHVIWCIKTTVVETSIAFRIESESRIGFWEAVIVASALKSGANRILSEDPNVGQTIAGIRSKTPWRRRAMPSVLDFHCIFLSQTLWSPKMAGCSFGLFYSGRFSLLLLGGGSSGVEPMDHGTGWFCRSLSRLPGAGGDSSDFQVNTCRFMM